MTYFIAPKGRYDENTHASANTVARPILMENPRGGLEPGVAIFNQRLVRSVLTLEDASRIADSLIDAVEHHHRPNQKKASKQK